MNENLNDAPKVTRTMMNAYGKYKDELSLLSHYKQNADELKSYPKRKRFCIFVDRRADKDKITMFEPPSNCNTMPKKHVSEWYFNASKVCILPGSKGMEFSDAERIVSHSDLQGQVMTLSFQIEASDIVKVLLFWRGRYTRIYPEDLETLFPDIFDMNCYDNDKWNGKQRDTVLKQIQITDVDFEQFYRQASYNENVDDFPRQYE